jgi:multidrug efflux pump subunit AcrA (membrane-fusion protein)
MYAQHHAGPGTRLALLAAAILGSFLASSCDDRKVQARDHADSSSCHTVSVVKALRKTLQRQLSVSSELVPFQQIDVYAKESGFVRQLNVDYGSRVRAGQTMAVLEIPELQAKLQQDQAAIAAQGDEVKRTEHEVSRVKAEENVYQLQYERLAGVATANPVWWLSRKWTMRRENTLPPSLNGRRPRERTIQHKGSWRRPRRS